MNTNYVLIDFENVQPASLELLTAEHFKVVVFVGACQNWVPFELAASLQQFGSRAQYVKVSARGSNALDFHIAYYLGRLAAAEPAAHFHVISKDTGFDPLIEHLRSQQIPVRRVGGVTEIPIVEANAKPVATSAPAVMPPQTAMQLPVATATELPVRGAIKSPAKPVDQPTVKAGDKVSPVDVGKRPEDSAAQPTAAKRSPDHLAVVVDQLKKSPSNRPRTVVALSHSIKSWLGGQASEADVARLVQTLKSQKYLTVTDTKKIEYDFSQRPIASASSLTKTVKTTLPPA